MTSHPALGDAAPARGRVVLRRLDMRSRHCETVHSDTPALSSSREHAHAACAARLTSPGGDPITRLNARAKAASDR